VTTVNIHKDTFLCFLSVVSQLTLYQCCYLFQLFQNGLYLSIALDRYGLLSPLVSELNDRDRMSDKIVVIATGAVVVPNHQVSQRDMVVCYGDDAC